MHYSQWFCFRGPPLSWSQCTTDSGFVSLCLPYHGHSALQSVVLFPLASPIMILVHYSQWFCFPGPPLSWSQCTTDSGFVSLGLPYHGHSALQTVVLFPWAFPIMVTVHYRQWFCFPGPSLSWSQCTTDSGFVSLRLPYHGHSALQTVVLFPWAFPIMVTVHYRQWFCFPASSLSWSQCTTDSGFVSLGLPYHDLSSLQSVILFPWASPIMVTVHYRQWFCFPGPSLSRSQCTTDSGFVSLGLPYHGHSALQTVVLFPWAFPIMVTVHYRQWFCFPASSLSWSQCTTDSGFVSLRLPYHGHSALQTVVLFPWAYPIMILVHYSQWFCFPGPPLSWSQCTTDSGFVSLGLPYHGHSALQTVLLFPCVFPIMVTVHYRQCFCFPVSSLSGSQCTTDSAFVSLCLPYHDLSALQSVVLFPWASPIMVAVHYRQWFCFPVPPLSWSQCTTVSGFVSLGLPYHDLSALQSVVLFPWASPIMVTVHYRQWFCFPGPSLSWSQCTTDSGFVSLGLPYHGHSALQTVVLFPWAFPIMVTVHYRQWFCFPASSLSWSQCTTDSGFVSLGLPYHGHSALQTVVLFPCVFPIMVTVHYRQWFCFPGPTLS